MRQSPSYHQLHIISSTSAASYYSIFCSPTHIFYRIYPSFLSPRLKTLFLPHFVANFSIFFNWIFRSSFLRASHPSNFACIILLGANKTETFHVFHELYELKPTCEFFFPFNRKLVFFFVLVCVFCVCQVFPCQTFL